MKATSENRRQRKHEGQRFRDLLIRKARTWSPAAILMVLGVLAAGYLKASIFVPRISDDAAEVMFDDLHKDVQDDLKALVDSADASNINIDIEKRTVDAKFVASLARVAYMGAEVRGKVLSSKLQTARLNLVMDIGNMIGELGDCGHDHTCKEIEALLKQNMASVAQTEKTGLDLLAIQERARGYLLDKDTKPSIDEHIKFLEFLTQSIRKPETLVKDWRKPAFDDIAKVDTSTAGLLRVHRDLYREYSSRRKVQEAITSMLTRSS